MLPTANPLTLEHRTNQIKLVRLVQLQSTANWSLLDFAYRDASALDWLARQAEIGLAGRERAAAQAANAYQEMRMADIGERLVVRTPPVIDTSAVRQTVTSLRVSGPVTVKQSMARGSTPAKAMSDGLASILSATQRLVMAGDRSMFLNLLGLEPSTVYYERVARSNGCDFCLMLAGRGPVYTAKTGDFQAHDNCSCMIQPKWRGAKKRVGRGGSKGTRRIEYRIDGNVSGPAVSVTGAPE